jgi:hypothetical protein
MVHDRGESITDLGGCQCSSNRVSGGGLLATISWLLILATHDGIPIEAALIKGPGGWLTPHATALARLPSCTLKRLQADSNGIREFKTR